MLVHPPFFVYISEKDMTVSLLVNGSFGIADHGEFTQVLFK
jgi:hypothetical protein